MYPIKNNLIQNIKQICTFKNNFEVLVQFNKSIVCNGESFYKNVWFQVNRPDLAIVYCIVIVAGVFSNRASIKPSIHGKSGIVF